MKASSIDNPDLQVSGGSPTPVKCWWMLGGVVAYKLCDRNYECEGCSFDKAIGNRQSGFSGAATGRRLIDQLAAESLLFHERHVWARLEEGGRVRTGLDDFGRRLAGRIYCVELPRVGARIEAGGAAWKAVHHEGEVALASPVSGVVGEVNERLLQNPALVNRDPYGAGWAIVLTPLDLARDVRGLRPGEEIAPWIAAESERLNRQLACAGSRRTMADGGRLADDLHEAIPPEARARILDLFLSANTNPVSGPPGNPKAGREGS
jgi:glycine cleavage system H lipoate-binding protein